MGTANSVDQTKRDFDLHPLPNIFSLEIRHSIDITEAIIIEGP